MFHSICCSANIEITRVRKSNESEIAVMKAALKKEQTKTASLEKSLQQKVSGFWWLLWSQSIRGVKEKRKKKGETTKKKKISFIVPAPSPHSDTDTQVTFFMDSPSVKWELSYKIVYGLWKRRFEREGERNLGARHHARARMEKGNLPPFLARPSCSSHDRNPLSFPFRTPARVRVTRHACPTLCGDRIRLLCFGFSTLSHLSNFRFLWRRWLRCSQSALWRFCFCYRYPKMPNLQRYVTNLSTKWVALDSPWYCQWLVYGLRLPTSC